MSVWQSPVAAGKCQKGRQVRSSGMPSAMLAESDVAVSQSGFHGRKFSRPQVLLAQQFIDFARAHCAKKHTLGVDPAAFYLLRAAADEYRTRGAERDQFMGVDRQMVEGKLAGVFDKIPGHPMIFAGRGDVLDLLAKVAAPDLGPAGSRGSYECDREARLVRHRHQCRLPVARQTFNAHALSID